jgi:FkbM family methyltransferase
MLQSIFRILVNKFIFKDSTYFLGMVLVRLSRKFRKVSFFKSTKNSLLVKKCLGNLTLELKPKTYMGGSLYWTGFHHISEMIYLRNILQNDMTFIDVGANQGEFSLYASSRLSKGQVYSFEPVSAQFNMLSKNIELNNIQNIKAFNFGLSDAEGELPVFTSSSSTDLGNNEGLSSLFSSNDRDVFEEKVKLEVFDDLFSDKIDRIDFIKIDVEGAELFVLKGMKETLKKFTPTILIELSEDNFKNAGYTTKDVLDFLNIYNYKPHKLFRGKIQEVQSIDMEWGNYVFISKK